MPAIPPPAPAPVRGLSFLQATLAAPRPAKPPTPPPPPAADVSSRYHTAPARVGPAPRLKREFEEQQSGAPSWASTMPVQRKQRTKRPSAMDIFSRDEGQLLSELVDGLSDPELERTETEQLETLAMLEQLADSEGLHAPASANPDVGALMLSMLPEDDSLVSPLSRQGTMLSMLHEQGVPSMAAAAAAAAAGPMAGAPRSSTPDSLATQFAAAQLAGDAAARQRGGRSGAERKEWSAAEDDTIRSAVALHGCKWRKIAAMLPGRSDDAVRNRWNRLKNEDAAAAAAEGGEVSAPPPPKPAAPRKPKAEKEEGGGAKPERVSWSRAEDATIVHSVAELGHKWYLIAQRLPGRTDHAIRNRYHRLQAMSEDQQILRGQYAAQHGLTFDGAPPAPPVGDPNLSAVLGPVPEILA